MAVNYIICLAGEGSRFAGVTAVPKPLIRLRGRTLLERSLDSLHVFPDDRLILVVRAAHGIRPAMEPVLFARYPFHHVAWVELDGPTRGQLETAVQARDHVDPAASIAVFNGDTYFQSPTLHARLGDPAVDGVIPCAQAEGTQWSFCRPGEGDTVADVREKERISPWATVGLYGFRDAGLFFDRAERALRRDAAGEYYVAPLYRDYLDEGRRIVMDRVTLFRPMGSPEQAARFWDVTEAELRRSNPAGTLVIDLDNTLTIEDPAVPYEHKTPRPDVIAKLREYKAAGYEIVIYSSRRMRTWRNDEARALADVGAATLAWLRRHEVPFDGIRFGKPFADRGFYVDDRTVRPDEFLRLSPAAIRGLLGEAP